ncbi:hypothetical protein C8R47DRAFT_1219671 [Mycena vitilis]|nr:hypothetical protein C8R47DRAFT_1219671 [Mycena vitilis]
MASDPISNGLPDKSIVTWHFSIPDPTVPVCVIIKHSDLPIATTTSATHIAVPPRPSSDDDDSDASVNVSGSGSDTKLMASPDIVAPPLTIVFGGIKNQVVLCFDTSDEKPHSCNFEAKKLNKRERYYAVVTYISPPHGSRSNLTIRLQIPSNGVVWAEGFNRILRYWTYDEGGKPCRRNPTIWQDERSDVEEIRREPRKVAIRLSQKTESLQEDLDEQTQRDEEESTECALPLLDYPNNNISSTKMSGSKPERGSTIFKWDLEEKLLVDESTSPPPPHQYRRAKLVREEDQSWDINIISPNFGSTRLCLSLDDKDEVQIEMDLFHGHSFQTLRRPEYDNEIGENITFQRDGSGKEPQLYVKVTVPKKFADKDFDSRLRLIGLITVADGDFSVFTQIHVNNKCIDYQQLKSDYSIAKKDLLGCAEPLNTRRWGTLGVESKRCESPETIRLGRETGWLDELPEDERWKDEDLE